MERYLRQFLHSDLKSKMVFVGGPSQVGKTTLAVSFLSPPSAESSGYLNWDNLKNRASLLYGELPLES